MKNEQLIREVADLKTDIAQLKNKYDAMKDENKQLGSLLDKISVNNQNQMQQINSQSSEIMQLKTKVQQLKVRDHMTPYMQLQNSHLMTLIQTIFCIHSA